LLVDEFNANVQTQNTKEATAFDVVLEAARRFPEGLRGNDSVSRWSRLAYRSALYLQEKLEVIEGLYHLTPLHLATYIGYHDEVVRLVHKEPNAVFETNWEGETPRQMLQNSMPVKEMLLKRLGACSTTSVKNAVLRLYCFPSSWDLWVPFDETGARNLRSPTGGCALNSERQILVIEFIVNSDIASI
jgi:hypothetical protein